MPPLSCGSYGTAPDTCPPPPPRTTKRSISGCCAASKPPLTGVSVHSRSLATPISSSASWADTIASAGRCASSIPRPCRCSTSSRATLFTIIHAGSTKWRIISRTSVWIVLGPFGSHHPTITHPRCSSTFDATKIPISTTSHNDRASSSLGRLRLRRFYPSVTIRVMPRVIVVRVRYQLYRFSLL